jgi:hypothetical protein
LLNTRLHFVTQSILASLLFVLAMSTGCVNTPSPHKQQLFSMDEAVSHVLSLSDQNTGQKPVLKIDYGIYLKDEPYFYSLAQKSISRADSAYPQLFDTPLEILIVRNIVGSRHCPVRGSASSYMDGQVIKINASLINNPIAFEAVLDHELGHLIFNHRFDHASHQSLDEGFATYYAKQSWITWTGYAAWEDAREGREASSLIASTGLTEEESNPYSAPCLEQRSRRYTEWAVFIEFLLDTYGEDKFAELIALPLHAAISQTGEAEDIVYCEHHFYAYWQVYNKTLSQLEGEWSGETGAAINEEKLCTGSIIEQQDSFPDVNYFELIEGDD